MTRCLLLVCIAYVGLPHGFGELPPELKRSIELFDFRRADIIRTMELAEKPGVIQRVRTRIADNGRSEERTWDRPNAILPVERTHSTRNLWQGEKFYTNAGNSVISQLYEDGAKSPMRFANPFLAPFGGDLDELSSYSRYSVSRDGGLTVVQGIKNADGGRELRATWWLNAEKGGRVEQYELEINGRLSRRVLTTYVKAGAEWAPHEIEEFLGSNLEEPRKRTRYERFEVDQERLPSELAPADIGVEVGTVIHRHTQAGPSRENLMWDGESPVSASELMRRVKLGEVRLGAQCELERMLAENAPEEGSPAQLSYRESPQTAEAVRHRPGLWEEYVRFFIRQYQLSLAQEERAWTIYRDCHGRAEAHIDRNREKYDRLVVELGDPERVVLAMQQESDLMAPIRDIFESSLRPRLHSLLTRAQSETSQPSSTRSSDR